MFFSRYPFAAFQVLFFFGVSFLLNVFFFRFVSAQVAWRKRSLGKRGLVCFISMWMECFLFSFFFFFVEDGFDLVIGWLGDWMVGWLVGWLAGWLFGWLVGDNVGLFRWWKAREEGAAAAAGDGGAGDGNCFLLGG